MQRPLIRQLRSAGRALGEMLFNARVFLFGSFFAGVEDQKAGNFPARPLLRWAHNSPPNWLRNFRVARNSEFFTVSSVVPSTSPIARSFNPW